MTMTPRPPTPMPGPPKPTEGWIGGGTKEGTVAGWYAGGGMMPGPIVIPGGSSNFGGTTGVVAGDVSSITGGATTSIETVVSAAGCVSGTTSGRVPGAAECEIRIPDAPNGTATARRTTP